MAEDESPECDLCGNPIVYRVLQPCNHNNICFQCYIRYLKMYNGDHCYFCQKPNVRGQEPIVVTSHGLSYQKARSHNPVFNKQSNCFLEKPQIAAEINHFYEFKCPECGTILPAVDALASHMKLHKKSVCCICYNANRFLPCECPIFTMKEYGHHLRQHPRCLCCNYTAFDQNSLAKHMLERHHRCDICAKANKILWFKDATDLVKHNEEVHFVCHHPECASENFIAFATRGELLMHLQKIHGEREREIDFAHDFIQSVAVTEDVPSQRERMRELNKILIRKLNDVFGENKEPIARLKAEAKKLIEDDITCEQFYRSFSNICGQSKNLLFCDMVASMPDAKKRMELFRIHNGIDQTKPPKSHSAPNLKAAAGPGNGRRQQQSGYPGLPRNQSPQSSIAAGMAAAAAAPQPSQGGRRKGKKVILTSF